MTHLIWSIANFGGSLLCKRFRIQVVEPHVSNQLLIKDLQLSVCHYNLGATSEAGQDNIFQLNIIIILIID